MRGLFEGWHIVILLIVVLVLFGARRLPDSARSLGRSMRIFKSEIRGMSEDDQRRKSADADHRPIEPVRGRIVEDGRLHDADGGEVRADRDSGRRDDGFREGDVRSDGYRDDGYRDDGYRNDGARGSGARDGHGLGDSRADDRYRD